ncbi:MAG: YgfZ/GcvT domain-containing protein [Acidimicrobiales bacterium]
MDDADSDRQRLRDDVVGRWLDRDAISVSGRDAVAFLQGQCSQDVAALGVGESKWTWILQPRGKVEVLARVSRTGADAMVLDTDGGWGEAMLTRLNRFKLRTKADIEPLDWRCLGLRGPRSAEAAAFADGIGRGGTVLALDASWPGLPGVDLMGPDPQLPPGVTLAPDEVWEWARVEAGVPRMGAELTEDTIPAETGLVATTVSFTKGCYTGQELVARIDSRGGHVPRHLRRVVLDQPAPVGARVTVDGKEAGRLTSVAPVGDGGAVALAYLARNVVPPAAVAVSWDGGITEGTAESLPLLS